MFSSYVEHFDGFTSAHIFPSDIWTLPFLTEILPLIFQRKTSEGIFKMCFSHRGKKMEKNYSFFI